jgi:succinoglycan biosynthesis transport protein ExoP
MPRLIGQNGANDAIETHARIISLQSPESGLSPLAGWEVVKRYFLRIAALVVVVMAVTAIVISMETRLYTAKSTILIGPQNPNVIASSAIQPSTSGSPIEADYFQTQCDILRSRSLAERVIRKLGLEHNPLIAGADLKPDSASESALDPQIIDNYLAVLRIIPVEDTSLVTITATTTDRKLSAAIADTHASEYIKQGVDIRGRAYRDARVLLQQRLGEIKGQLEKSEITLNDYRREKGIIPGLVSLNGKDAVMLDRLSDLSKQFTQAQVTRIGFEAQINLIRSGQYQSLPAVMDDNLLRTLEINLSDLTAQDAGLANKFKPEFPARTEMHAKINDVRTEINQETKRVVDGINDQYRAALDRENRLQDAIAKERTATLNINDAAVQYAFLERDVDTNRQLYESVLKAVKDIGELAETQTSNVSIIDHAEPPRSPSSPRPIRTLVMAFAMSLATALALAFLADYLDDSVRTPLESERLLGLPTLVAVPRFDQRTLRDESLKRLASKVDDERSVTTEVATVQSKTSFVLETYRQLRTALLLSKAGGPPKTILVASALPGEGKTVTAVNAAVVLSQLGGKVLLIDADLRHPRCHELFRMENTIGLSTVLAGSGDCGNSIRPASLINNLYFLGCGPMPPDPTKLLGSPRMREVLEQLQGQFDFIVIDSPPVLLATDAVLISTLVDGVVIVVDAVGTPREQVKAAYDRLEYGHANILGVVLNKTTLSEKYYSRFQGYYSAQGSDLAPRGV